MIRASIELRGGKAFGVGADGQPAELSDDPIALAQRLYRLGEITIFDLDATTGHGDNLETIRQICRVAECRVGGGIRDHKRADSLLRAGAKQIIIGTAADEEFLAHFPRAKVLVAFDVDDGRVVRRDAAEGEVLEPLELALRVKERCSGFVYFLVGHRADAIGREASRFEMLRSRLPGHSITAMGTFSSVEEIQELDRVGVDCQLTYGALPPAFDLVDAFVSIIDFDKGGGLVPVVVQDQAGQVLSLLHANREAVRLSMQTGHATYWSPVRGEHWTKGQSSGNTQEVLTSYVDCDRDALVFVVRPQGAACHLGAYSCFGDLSFSLHRLEHALRTRQAATDPRRSYTQVMLSDREGVRQKIAEESQAVCSASTRDEILWETADLVYFLLLNLVREGISLDEVIKELRGRAGRKR